MATRNPLVLNNGQIQQLQPVADDLYFGRVLAGTESSGVVTIDNAQICRIITSTLTVRAGETYLITLLSNRIKTTSSLMYGLTNNSNTTGLPHILSVTPDAFLDGSALITLLNLGGQKDSDDFNGTLYIHVLIINL